MENASHKDPRDRYYNFEKNQIIILIPEGPHVVLDLGCATGKLGRKLLSLNKATEMVGVEIFEPAAEEAAQYYTKVYCGDLESLNIDYNDYFDYVICGDILEHLRDPWKTLDRIRGWLKEDGNLIASIPNVRYWRVLADLMIFGKWNYVEAGILDNTHLRFFTRSTFLQTLTQANFEIVKHEMWVSGRKKRLANTLTLGLFEEFLGSQIMVVAKKKK